MRKSGIYLLQNLTETHYTKTLSRKMKWRNSKKLNLCLKNWNYEKLCRFTNILRNNVSPIYQNHYAIGKLCFADKTLPPSVSATETKMKNNK